LIGKFRLVNLGDAFEWISLPPEDRQPSQAEMVKGGLLELWRQMRERIGAERFDSSLGEVRAGKFMRHNDGVWTQTNAEHEQGDYVNLTLELDRNELSLNVIGWFDPQLEKVERWLRKPAAWRFMRTLEGWCIVVFVRHAHLDRNGKPNFRGAPGKERERIPIGETGAASISTMLIGLRPKLDPGREKPALHIRRAWNPAEAASLDDLPGSVAAEVEAWLDPLDQIRLA
jgi:hypothetical protein